MPARVRSRRILKRMRVSNKILLAGVLGTASLLLLAGKGPAPQSAFAASDVSSISIDYPLDGSVFPPEITPPTFVWHDNASAKRWLIEFSFANGGASFRFETTGYAPQITEIDEKAGSGEGIEQGSLPEISTRTWRPDAATWAKIKSRSVKAATVTISGFAEDDAKRPVSRGMVTITTSADPVGAPIFYRDVPLLISPRTEKGMIQPLPPSALPLIKWRLRNIAEPESRTVMEGLYTCANCHSFSRDGKTMGLDMDGPKNDKGLYAILSVQKLMTVRNQDLIRWSSFQENLGAANFEPTVKRFGFMSQISPDGRYVVTSIGPPGIGNSHQDKNPGFAPGLSDRLFSTVYRDIAFTQVFYPMRGILAFYDRSSKKLRPLPGADNPKFVHTSAFWSPDGKYLIFSRALARDPYPPGAESPSYANDPREPQIQYDLYRIPFNDGKGGEAEPVAGASGNGMSNDFPKVSPDGRWIVFVQNHNGLLMRPDSRLYIVPFAGGQARLMKCNTSLMNSWHSFSPNGRWLAFSSKSHGPYTRLMLTHIDADGNDTPAILVDNTTAANRAVNIPEFVNIPPDGLQKIDPEAIKGYRYSDIAFELMEKNQLPEAIEEWHKVLELDPDNASAHFSLAVSLSGIDREREAVEEYRKACDLDPHHAGWFNHLAVSLALTGNPDAAVESWKKSLTLEPSNAEVEMQLGAMLVEKGEVQEGLEHLRRAVDLAPEVAGTHNALGWELAKAGGLDEAVEQLQKAVALNPDAAGLYSNLGHVLELRGDSGQAATVLEKAVQLSQGKEPQALAALADAYERTGRFGEAIQTADRALELARETHDGRLEKKMRDNIARYEVEQEKAKAGS